MTKESEIALQLQFDELVEAIQSVNNSIGKLAAKEKPEYYDKELAKVLKSGFNISLKQDSPEVKIDLTPIAGVMNELKNQNQLLINQNKQIIELLQPKQLEKQDNSEFTAAVKEMINSNKELVRALIENSKVKRTINVQRNQFSGFIEKINEA